MTKPRAKSKKDPKKNPKKKHPGGRPEKFSRDEILAWESDYLASCSQGMSDRIFLGKKGLDRKYIWQRSQKDVPEFSDILKRGKALQEEFYTKLGLAGAAGHLKNFNVGAFVWITKHMLGWWDKAPEFDEEEAPSSDSKTTTFKSRFAGEVES